MNELFNYSIYFLNPFFLIYFGFINLIYTILLFYGVKRVNSRARQLAVESLMPIYRSESLPEITFMVAAYNEESDILTTIDNLLALSYEYKRILIINDGSTDGTLDLLKRQYHLLPMPKYYEDKLPSKPVRGLYQSKSHPIIQVIDKENGEKFDALNAGLNACTTTFFITVDADTCIEDANFESLIRPIFFEKTNVALGAAVYIKNGCLLKYNQISPDIAPGDYLSAMQSIEYIRAFLSRQGWNYLGGNVVISGAFSILLTKVVMQCGGFAPTIANDMEIIIRLNRILIATKTPYRIIYLPDPVAWTDAPMTIRELGRQRAGWHRGLLESIWYNRVLFFNTNYRPYGFWTFSFLVLAEALEPLVELLAYLYVLVGLWLHAFDTYALLLILCVVWMFNFFLSLAALLVEETTFSRYTQFKRIVYLMYYSLIENLGYKQMNLWWRIRGFYDFFRKFSKVQQDSKFVNKCVEDAISKGEIKW